MDDFLHNLRSGQLKKYGKSQGGYYHPNRERRADGDRRMHDRRQSSYLANQLIEIIEKLIPTLENALPDILNTQNRIAVARENIYHTEKRKMAAMEEISKSLITIASSGILPDKGSKKPDMESDDLPVQDKNNDSFETLQRKAEINREKAIDIIMKMRSKKKTYDQIAQFLTERKYPTFSHRGEWHAQTVHRLYKKNY